MKRNLLLISMMTGALAMMAATQFDNGKWSLVHDNNRLDITYDGQAKFANVYATVTYNLAGDDTQYTIKSNSGRDADISSESISDEFGEGTRYIFSYTDGRAVMKQNICIYNDHPYLIVGATIAATDGGRVESRKMIPFATGSSSYPLGEGTTQRILWVPFDNESHTLRYKSSKFGATVKSPEGWLLDVSSEVSAIYEPQSRKGIVIGSVDHDKWKSGITIEHKTGGRVPKIECLSGWTDYNLTKDALPHGKVKGTEVASARYMVGCFDDWREGMDTFGYANNLVVPRPEWGKGNPIGWNSWGNMMNHINYDGVYETAQFMHENLRQYGFHDNDDQITISLDSFNGNLGDIKIYELGTKTFKNGTYREGRETKEGWNMVLGMYGGMVVWSWTLGNKVDGTGLNGTRDYTWGDVALKVNGEVYGHGTDALAMDPTHPAVRANLEWAFAQWARSGTKYIKMDFVNAAIREGDSWYDPEITTGTMAYNYGMKIVMELAEKYDMYVVLAMSPLFPYQYAHGRRTCCDRWGRLGESEFVMNAISYGWWTDRLYTVNDPDQMTMCQNEQNASETLGENRARATSGMASGAFIFGDNFSDHCYYTDDTKSHSKGQVCGYPAESRRRAIQIMGNRDINDYVRNNVGSFRPVEGDHPSLSQDAENLYMRDTPQYLYLAIFNWNYSTELKGNVSFERLGIDPSNVGTIKELWSGDEVQPVDNGISYSMPLGDAIVYRITKLDYVPDPSAVETVIADEETSLKAEITAGVCNVESPCGINAVTIYDMTGIAVASTVAAGETTVTLPADVTAGIYIVSCRLADGTSRSVKAVATL